jgi:hypothetical protein
MAYLVLLGHQFDISLTSKRLSNYQNPSTLAGREWVVGPYLGGSRIARVLFLVPLVQVRCCLD